MHNHSGNHQIRCALVEIDSIVSLRALSDSIELKR